MPDNVRVVPLRRSALLRIVLFGTCAMVGVSLCGAEVEKANNPDALNLGSSWTLGTAPTGTDVALWTANSARSSLTLGASVSWAGIKVSNPGGSVAIGAGNVLTLGTNGLVVNIGSGSALSLSHALDIAGDQTWTIGGSTGVGLSGALSGSNRTINIVSGGSGSYVNLYGSAANFRGTINYGGAARLNLRGAFAGTNVTVNLTAPRAVYADSTIGTVVIGEPVATLRFTGRRGIKTSCCKGLSWGEVSRTMPCGRIWMASFPTATVKRCQMAALSFD